LCFVPGDRTAIGVKFVLLESCYEEKTG